MNETQNPASSESVAPPAADTPEARIQALETELAEKDNRYRYLYAEFDNFKKRTIREKTDALKFACEGMAHDLLPVVDNLERALAHAPDRHGTLAQGIEMVLRQFLQALERQGVRPVESVGKAFDPAVHEAVDREVSEKDAEGTVLLEHARGYLLHGRLLRPARVRVSAKPETP